MTPTSTSYTLPNELSGCDGTSNTCIQNTLNPSELNLWRVIRKNEDGTVDMVSEYVSNKKVYFYGQTGYMNLVGGLNTIAAQYTNNKYVAKTRHIGYSNQTEYITDTSALSSTVKPFRGDTSNIAGWEKCESSKYICGEDENKGAGDVGYEIDYDLVNNVYGTMSAMSVTGNKEQYWLASRMYRIINIDEWYFRGRLVEREGEKKSSHIYTPTKGTAIWFDGWAIRPILTFKSEIKISGGSGTKSSPYTLS